MGQMVNQITFKADRVKISGPRVDESYVISFETGEYERTSLAELFLVEADKILEVSVRVKDGR